MYLPHIKEEQERLRKECRFLKWGSDVKYKDIASAIGIKDTTFYNWLSGATKLGYESQYRLDRYIKEFYLNGR